MTYRTEPNNSNSDINHQKHFHLKYFRKRIPRHGHTNQKELTDKNSKQIEVEGNVKTPQPRFVFYLT